MQSFFLELFNLALSAGWLALAILVVRLIFPRLPKGIRMGMWALLGLRLCLPFSIESALSLIPSREPLPPEILISASPTIESGIPAVNEVINPVISGTLAPTAEANVNPVQMLMLAAGVIWLAGAAVMLLYAVISGILLHRRVRVAIACDEKTFLCDAVDAPFVLGIFRPRIYLPSAISEADAAQVLLHERAHLARRDHIWKPLGFLLRTVYWFHPVFWFAFRAFAKDIEYACDALVIRDMDLAARKSYSEALLAASTRRFSLACPLAFGEEDVRGRLSAVLSYKKPAFWLSLVGVVLCVCLALGFLTDPVTAGWQSENVDVVGLTCAAECEDVVFEHQSDNLMVADPYIIMNWINYSETDALCFGDNYVLWCGDEQINADMVFDSGVHQLGSGVSYEERISLAGVKLSKGSYLLEKEFWFSKEPETKYRAYIRFVVEDVASFLGKSYNLEEENGNWHTALNGEILWVPSSGGMIYFGDGLAGEYDSYTELTRENFDLLFAKDQRAKARRLRKENNIAIEIYDYGNDAFYFLLEQKNGELWFLKGETTARSVSEIYRMQDSESVDPGYAYWYDGITMEVLFGDANTLELVLKRDGSAPAGERLVVGETYLIYRQTDDEQLGQLVAHAEKEDWYGPMYVLPEKGELRMTCDISNVAGSLTPGAYTLIKPIYLYNDGTNSVQKTYTYFCSFAIVNESGYLHVN